MTRVSEAVSQREHALFVGRHRELAAFRQWLLADTPFPEPRFSMTTVVLIILAALAFFFGFPQPSDEPSGQGASTEPAAEAQPETEES